MMAENVHGANTIVCSTAITGSNPELTYAKENNITILHRSDVLNILASDKKAIFVAGSHGKTSTAGLLAHVLKYAGLSPSAVIGGKMLNYNDYYLDGDGQYFIAEADESDGSFLKYKPFVSIVSC